MRNKLKDFENYGKVSTEANRKELNKKRFYTGSDNDSPKESEKISKKKLKTKTISMSKGIFISISHAIKLYF